MSPLTMETVTDVLAYQTQCKRTGQYQEIGRLKKIVLEANKDSHIPGRSETDRVGLTLDLYNGFIPLAQTMDRSQLLLLGNFVVSDGKGGSRVGLPDIPDPQWVPGQATAAELTNPDYKPNRARMVPQRFEDRTGEKWKENPEYFVFHPVVQLMIHMPDMGPKDALGALVECRADVQGKHVTLLISKLTGEAFFYGGVHTIRMVG